MWAWVAMAGAVELGDDARFVDDHAELREGARFAFADGYGFPVREGGELLGYVFVGEGSVTLELAVPGEAAALADGLVHMRHPVEEARAVMAEGSWTGALDAAVVWRTDPRLEEDVGSWQRVVEDRDAVGYVDPSGMFVVVVTPLDVDAARRTAEEALNGRLRHLRQAGLDPLAARRDQALDPGEPREVIEVRGPRSWAPLLGHPSGDRWLTWVVDPAGIADDAHTRGFRVFGVEAHRVHRRVLTGSGTPLPGLVVVDGAANVIVGTEAGGVAAAVTVEASLLLEARRDVELLALRVPDDRPFDIDLGEPPMADGLRLGDVVGEGGEVLEALSPPFGASADRAARVIRVPRVAAGGRIRVRARHTDRWRVSNLLEVKPWALRVLLQRGACPGPECPSLDLLPEQADLGEVAPPRRVVPVVLGPGPPAAVEVRVATSLGERWTPLLGGAASRRLASADGGEWSVAELPPEAGVGVARLVERAWPARRDLPGLRLLARAGAAADLSPSFPRAVLHFFEAALPPFPGDELDVVAGPQVPFLYQGFGVDERLERLPRPLVAAGPGSLVVYGVRELSLAGPGASLERLLNNRFPHALERGLVVGIAAQWWAWRGAAAADAWIGEVMPAVYADLFAERAWPDEARDERLARRAVRASLTAPALPLREPGPWTTPVGREVIGGGLLARIGERALLEGLARFLERGDTTTEGLLDALQESTEVDVALWLEHWVYVGTRPKAEVDWEPTATGASGELCIDLPVARLELPIEVSAGDRRAMAWVPITEGCARFSVELGAPASKVEVDPEGWLPLR